MSGDLFEIMDQLTPLLRRGDLGECERVVVGQLRLLPASPFHCVVGLSISNSPHDAAKHFDKFFRVESEQFDIAAAYTEMNGFYINPDRWYCDLFAYESYGGHDDYDWLADWQSEEFDEYELHGFEELQKVYASGEYGESQFSNASDLCSLLVVLKFQQFIGSAAPLMKQLRFPLLSTAHEFEFIAEVKGNA